MIRSFTQHLQDNAKLYEFKLRLAVPISEELMKRIEVALDAYDLESISKAKRLPIQEDTINFPQLGPIEINLIDIAVKYPVIPEAIASLLSERANIPKSHMSVYTKAQEVDRTPALVPQDEDKSALLDTAPEDRKHDETELYGNEHISSFLDSLDSRDYEIAGDKVDAPTTTNDLDQGTQSPMTKQNKVPTAEDL